MTPRRLRVAALAAVLAPVLAACGFSAQTEQVYQAANGSNDRAGEVDVLNAMIVSGRAGAGTLVTTLVNNNQNDSDALTAVGGSGVTAKGGSVLIPGGDAVNLATSPNAIFLTGDKIAPGNFVRLQLSFSSGQTTTINVPVMANQGDYRDVPVQPSGSASPSASPAS